MPNGAAAPLVDEQARREPLPRAVTPIPAWPGVLALFLVGSGALHHHVLGDLAGRATGWTSSDSVLFTWWLHWVPWALLDGRDPLVSTLLNAPAGVNAMWNTSVPVLGLLLAPFTLTLGPTVAFNVGMVLGPAVSGLAAYLALRPFANRPARVLAGALYGFCPFVVAHGSVGHLNLVWAVLPPVLLWAVHEVLVVRRPRRAGVVTGVALAVQTGLYTQMVALGVVAVAVVAVVLVVARPARVREYCGDVGRSVGSALGVWLLLAAYPLWLVLAGPVRPHGPIRDPAATGADAAGLLVPTGLTALRGDTEWFRVQLSGLPGEQGAYLGLGVLVLVVVAVVAVPSFPLRVAAATGAVLALLSVGESLRVLGHDTGLPLPWAVTGWVPLLDQAAASRLAPFVALCVAVVVAVAADRAAAGRRWVLLALVAWAAVSWVPSGDQAFTDATAPPYFTAGAPGLTRDDIVATWPRPSSRFVAGADPMLWQSAAGFGFRLAGGYFIGSAPGHPVLYEGVPTAYDTARRTGDPAAARADLDRAGVTAVLVVPRASDQDAGLVLDWTARVTGDPGRYEGGVWLFRR